MKRKIRGLTIAVITAIAVAGNSMAVGALEEISTETAIAGISVPLSKLVGSSENAALSIYSYLAGETETAATTLAETEGTTEEETTIEPSEETTEETTVETTAETTTAEEETSPYADVAISQVENYVNVRTEPNTTSGIVGKLYNNCAATIMEEVDGEAYDTGNAWYHIVSGSVEGYVRADLFVTGAEAEAIAETVGTKIGTITADALYLRAEPSTDAEIITKIMKGTEVALMEQVGDFYHIQLDVASDGYIHKDYVSVRIEFSTAISIEEEQAQLAEQQRLQEEQAAAEAAAAQAAAEAAAAQAAQEAAAAAAAQAAQDAAAAQAAQEAAAAQAAAEAQAAQEAAAAEAAAAQAAAASSQSSSLGQAIVAYAMQFKGNPYVYGGTSLTNGTDCSGFTLRVYQNFGISLSRTSRTQANGGRQISLAEVQPGDLVFYTGTDNATIGHVAIYIGNGQIIHAANASVGIIVSDMYYRTPCKAVTYIR